MNVFILDESLLIWKVALESEYIRYPLWVDWADKQIIQLDSPPLWLLEMSLYLASIEKLSSLHSLLCALCASAVKKLATLATI